VNLDELSTELSGGTIRAAYLLAGEEPLIRDDALVALREAVLAGAAADWNLDRLAGETTSPAALRDAVNALPMMAARRLVVLREPEARRGSAKALTEAVAELVPALLAQSQSVLVVVAAKADKRARWVKAFADALVECTAPTSTRALSAFVTAEAKRQGLHLERGVADLLAERVGPQLLLLRQELAKASLLAGGPRIALEHAEASTGDVAEQPIWDLTDAIGEGRTADAISLLARLQSGGAAAPVVLGTLASHFRKLLRLGSGGRVPGPPFVVRKLESQARRYPPGRLLACLQAIHEADTALKGATSMGPELVLERLVLGLSS
jgi:DNA polymerase-3 subunit delta